MKKYVVLTCNWLADACKTEYVNFFTQIPNKENATLLRKVSFVRTNLNTIRKKRKKRKENEVSNGEREKGKTKIRAKMSRNVCSTFT